MAYHEITEQLPDGSVITYKEYKKSKAVAFFLAVLIGATGIHFFYTRRYLEGLVMILVSLACFLGTPEDSFWQNVPHYISFICAFFYLVASRAVFDDFVNGR